VSRKFIGVGWATCIIVTVAGLAQHHALVERGLADTPAGWAAFVGSLLAAGGAAYFTIRLITGGGR
jgi:hypothetical protein